MYPATCVMNLAEPSTLPLRDIHLPPPVAWWPLAPGWSVLALAVVLLGVIALWAWRRHRRGRTARAALTELATIEARYTAEQDAHACAQALSRLARRMALTWHDPRAAAATGEDWVAILSEASGMALPPPLRAVLLEAPYSPDAAAALGPEQLAEAVHHLSQVFRRSARRRPARV